jgi:hypothetical protein
MSIGIFIVIFVSKGMFIMIRGTNKNHSYKHNEQINNQNIDDSECFGVKFVKIYPEMTSQYYLFLSVTGS